MIHSRVPAPRRPVLLRVGVPEPGGALVDIARQARLPVLFSANAFIVRDKLGCPQRIQRPNPARFEGLDAALDSAGYVAGGLYRDYPWSVELYLDLVQANGWAWYSAMDLCCEIEVAGDSDGILFHVAETCRNYRVLNAAARARGLASPMPVLQGWHPGDYLWCIQHYPLDQWPALVGIGTMCRRPVDGPLGVVAILDALDQAMPPHVRFHLFGVKGPSLAVIGQHPRVASVDSMAWDYAARRDHPRGRTSALRGRYMLDWAERNRALSAGAQSGYTGSLFPVEPTRPTPLLARWLELVLEDQIEASVAAYHYHHHSALYGWENLEDAIACD